MDDVRQSHDIGTCLTISHEGFAETWEYLTRDTALPAAIDEQSDARGGLDIRLGRWQIFRSAPVILAVPLAGPLASDRARAQPLAAVLVLVIESVAALRRVDATE